MEMRNGYIAYLEELKANNNLIIILKIVLV